MEENIVGKRIGLYDVIYECDHRYSDGHRLYHVKCSKCGFETNIIKSALYRVSNCHHKAINGGYINYNIKWSVDRLRKIYSGIKRRCYNTHEKSYKWYGAKGIKICDEWLNNPLSFEQWSLDNGYDDTLTIDRIDESKDYCPRNCRWVSQKDNSKYKSTTKLLTIDGESHTGREWADILNLGTNTINTMLRNNTKDVVIKFIKARIKDKTKKRKSHQSWFDVYNIT